MPQSTLLELLEQRSESAEAEALAIRFWERGLWIEWSWREYWAAAQRAACALRQAGVRKGDHVLMLASAVRPPVAALFRLWRLGAVPIHLGEPTHLVNRAAFLNKLADTAERLNARFLLVAPQDVPLAPHEQLRVLSTDLIFESKTVCCRIEPVQGEIAFLQLTSGSTSDPRAAIVSHERLLLHMASMSRRLPSHSDSVAASWLPLHHDMGLVGGLLFPFYNGFPAHMISTADFQRSPGIWLETMSRFRVTITAAPPSAYAICIALAGRLQRRGCDLSAWECAMVGAEPISPLLLERFAGVFASSGFRREAFFPVYGLAEATVAVTFPQLLAKTRIDHVERPGLEREGRAVKASDDKSSLAFVGLGTPIDGTHVRITGDGGLPLTERCVGEVHVYSSSLALGYYRDAKATSVSFQEGWLHTGDLGYMADGELFITGRKKEIIIKGGRNLIPSILEEIAGAVSGVRPGGVAAVGVSSAEFETELVCIAAETRCEEAEHPVLAESIRSALKISGVAVDRIFLFPPKSLPKTTSGKLQRLAIARMLRVEVARAPLAAAKQNVG
jgi:acyl-CoA synthetase (AMP-forming)/AMP-acid ligase II